MEFLGTKCGVFIEPYNESDTKCDTEMWYQSDTNYEIDSMWGGFWGKIDEKYPDISG